MDDGRPFDTRWGVPRGVPRLLPNDPDPIVPLTGEELLIATLTDLNLSNSKAGLPSSLASFNDGENENVGVSGR